MGAMEAHPKLTQKLPEHSGNLLDPTPSPHTEGLEAGPHSTQSFSE